MALILDKTTTGVTSTYITTGVTSGFVATGYTEITPTNTGYIETSYFENTFRSTTITTGLTNLNYIDPFGGINANPYLIINSVSIDRINKFAKIGVSIYINITSRNNLNRPIELKYHEISYSVLFDTYFSMDLLDTTNVFAKAYEYINTIYTGWKSDE